MKIGQATKNALAEFKSAKWQKIDRNRGREITGLEVTVDPKFGRAVQILIGGGLKLLQAQKFYEEMEVFLDNNIYLRIGFKKGDNNIASPVNFMSNLEVAINDYVKQLIINWHPSKISFRDLIIPAEYLRNYSNDDPIILEHSSSFDSDVLLRILADQYDYYPKYLDIANSSEQGAQFPNIQLYPKRDYIVGKHKFVNKLLGLISTDLSPANFFAELPEAKPSQAKPEDKFLKTMSRLSLFQPEIFSGDKLLRYGVPDSLIQKISNAQMDHITSYEEMEKYQGKIVIYKTDGYCGKTGYTIYPKNPELKIGIISNKVENWDTGEKAWQLYRFMTPKMVGGYNALTTSELKYSNFNIRIALPGELDKLKQALVSKQAVCECDYLQLNKNIEIVAELKADLEKMIAQSKMSFLT